MSSQGKGSKLFKSWVYLLDPIMFRVWHNSLQIRAFTKMGKAFG